MAPFTKWETSSRFVVMLNQFSFTNCCTEHTFGPKLGYIIYGHTPHSKLIKEIYTDYSLKKIRYKKGFVMFSTKNQNSEYRNLKK